jgi:hypothetical protein
LKGFHQKVCEANEVAEIISQNPDLEFYLNQPTPYEVHKPQRIASA